MTTGFDNNTEKLATDNPTFQEGTNAVKILAWCMDLFIKGNETRHHLGDV